MNRKTRTERTWREARGRTRSERIAEQLLAVDHKAAQHYTGNTYTRCYVLCTARNMKEMSYLPSVKTRAHRRSAT